MEGLEVLGRILAFVFAAVLSYILYRVVTGAYAQYKINPESLQWRSRQSGGYTRVPRMREEVVVDRDVAVDQDVDEGYHDGESLDIERSSLLKLQKPLPERPLPDKPLPPVPGGG